MLSKAEKFRLTSAYCDLVVESDRRADFTDKLRSKRHIEGFEFALALILDCHNGRAQQTLVEWCDSAYGANWIGPKRDALDSLY